MTDKEIKELGLQPSDNHIGLMFVYGIPAYCKDEFNLWLAQYDPRKQEDLREKNLWFLFMYKIDDYNKKIVTQTVVSGDIIFNNFYTIIEEMKKDLNN